jgi:hypothetical protein
MTNDDTVDDGALDDEHRDAHTHYFYDSDGHLYADMTALRERGRIEVVPLGGAEVCVGVSEVRVVKERPVLNVATTQEGDTNLRDHFRAELDGETTLLDVPVQHIETLKAVATTLNNGHARPEDLYFLPGVSDEEIAALRE